MSRFGWSLALFAISGCVGVVGCGSGSGANSALEPLQLTHVAFEDVQGHPAPLEDYLTPEATPSELLVVRLVTPWCGPCQWQRANTESSITPTLRTRVHVLDVLLSNEDNGPPGPADIEAWSSASDGFATTVLDRDFALSELFPKRADLPYVALVDTKSLNVVYTLTNPSADDFTLAVDRAVARLDGAKAPTPPKPNLYDGRFSRDAWAMVQAMALPSEASRDPTNAYEAVPEAIALGKDLFFDADLSPSPKQVSCGACHLPELLFQDGKTQAPEGVGMGARNVPTVVLATEQRWQFWDGRADSAWAQAIMPIEDPNEMASSRLVVSHVLERKYKARYAAIFGALPAVSDQSRFPLAGKPGDPAWEAMTEVDRTTVNRIFANVGKAMAAYERSLRPASNAFDNYASGDTTALTEVQKDGLEAFLSAGCIQCHHGPRLTDDSFHNLRVPTGRPDRAADRGRYDGIAQLLKSDFRRSGAFSDAPTATADIPRDERLLGAFKTPGLRGASYTLPYGHGGSFGGLASTIDAHRTAGLAKESSYAIGTTERWLIEFAPELVPKIDVFLNVLTAEVPQ